MKHAYLLPPLIVLASCSQSPDELLVKAQEAYAAHDYAAARVQLAAALREEPDNPKVLLLRARTLLALGDGQGAGAVLEKLAGDSPPKGELAELMAEAALLRHAPDLAREFLSTENSAEASRLRALAYLQEHDLESAGKQFERATASGGNSRAFADYARFELLNGKLDAAQAMASRALQKDPDGLDALLVNGQIAVLKGDLKLALGRYQRAASSYPASVAARIGLAAVLGDLGRIDEMERIVAQLSKSGVSSRDLTYLEARGAAARKDWIGVRKLMQSAEADLPTYDGTRVLYAEALLHLGQPELAIAQVAPIARMQPANRAVVKLLAEAQLAAGDARAAFETLRPIADSDAARPDELQLMAKIANAARDRSAETYRTRALQPSAQALGADLAEADAAIRHGNWAKAVVAYDRILGATDGRNVMVLNNAAYAHLMLGNNDKALDFAGRAFELSPENPSVLDTMGWVLFKSGKDPKEARRLLQKGVGKAPRNPTIRAHLSEVERALEVQD